MTRTRGLDLTFLGLGLALLGWGAHQAFYVAPTERYMGNVYRIIFCHVPAGWMALLSFAVVCVCSIAYLWKSKPGADAAAEAGAEVGVLFSLLNMVSGSIWAKPTWDVWWSWDPRLTTVTIMFFAYAGYLALRQFVTESERRATWSAVVGILISASLPVVWFSVKWFDAGLHQIQSSPETLDPRMTLALRLNAFAFLAFMILFMRMRYRIAWIRLSQEAVEPPAAQPAEVAP